MHSVPADTEAAPTGGWSFLQPHSWFALGQVRLAAVLATVVLALFYVFLGPRYWEQMRHMVFDTYQSLAPRQVHKLPVVIVAIDNASLTALGQWPWPRTRLARLMEAIQQLGAQAIGLDIIMSGSGSSVARRVHRREV